jgi:dihydroorotate dehydrogenase electron transfer subunit
MRDFQAVTESNREIDPGYGLLRVRVNETIPILPGQFAMVKAHDVEDPVLRRALAIYRADGDAVEFLYQVLGRGTQALRRLRPGDTVDALLPLGNTFPTTPALRDGRRALVVTGGVGSASVLMLARSLTEQGADVRVLFGGRTSNHLPGWRDFETLSCPVLYATDDGSKGVHGFVTQLLENELDGDIPSAGAAVYSCGPWPMMARVADICTRRGVPSWSSVEAPMGCGFGICVACVVETREGYFSGPFRYQKVCTEGPVFPSEAIVW